ncbi:hypothetical protein ACFV6Y_39025 [Streptomyces massasporeus]|uniref:phage holin n=1 Tax=Streptomyces massasporeus TaxID=67324 RepID=UPI00366A2652
MSATDVFGIKSRDDLRAFIHSTAPALVTFLVGVGALANSVAPYVLALVLAVFDAGLARLNTVDGFRKWLYPVLGAFSSLGIFLGIVTEVQIAPWLALIPVILGGGVASKTLTKQLAA